MTIVDAEDRELPLVGGRQTQGVVRIGDTVRRPTGPHSPFVHDLLRYLQAVGFEVAPRLLGVDERGREILTFVEGEVPHGQGSRPPSDARLANAAATIRRLHDATAGSPLADGAEIVAHNELGPHNTVFVGDEPVAFIDWDDAAPGTRLFDLANAVHPLRRRGRRGWTRRGAGPARPADVRRLRMGGRRRDRGRDPGRPGQGARQPRAGGATESGRHLPGDGGLDRRVRRGAQGVGPRLGEGAVGGHRSYGRVFRTVSEVPGLRRVMRNCSDEKIGEMA